MKILHATLIGLSLSTLTLNAFAAATGWIIVMHTWGPEKNQYKIGGGHIFDNGAGVLASAMYDIGTTNQNIGRQLKSTFQEFEGWYPFKLDDQWSVTTGGLTDIDSAGSSISPYMSLDYKLNNVLSFSTRYRYNHITRRTADLNGNMSYNDAHQLDFFSITVQQINSGYNSTQSSLSTQMTSMLPTVKNTLGTQYCSQIPYQSALDALYRSCLAG
jgi:hypothetical protein